MDTALLLAKKKQKGMFVQVPENNITDLANAIFPNTTSIYGYVGSHGEAIGHGFMLHMPSYKLMCLRYLGNGQFENTFDASAPTSYENPNCFEDEIALPLIYGSTRRISLKKLQDSQFALLPANPNMNQGYSPIAKFDDTYFLRAYVSGTFRLASSTDLQTFTGGYVSGSGDGGAAAINTLDGDIIVEAINGANSKQIVTARNRSTGQVIYNKTNTAYNSGFGRVTARDENNIYFSQGSGELHIVDKNLTVSTHKLTESPFAPAYPVHSMFSINGTLYLFATSSIWTFKNGVFTNIPMPEYMPYCRGVFLYEDRFVILYSKPGNVFTDVCELFV